MREEIPVLTEMAKEVYSQTFGYSFTDEELASELQAHKSEEYFIHAIEQEGDQFLVADDNGKIIGYVGLRNPDMDVIGRQPTDQDQALNGIYVRKEYQGKGIGKQLMQAAFDQSRFQNAEFIYLSVWEENKPAYNFYLNYGFEAVGKREIVIDNKVVGHDLVLAKAAKK